MRAQVALAVVGILTQMSIAGAAAGGPARAATHGRIAAATIGSTLEAESFSTDATAPNLWSAIGDACLTAGDTATPTSSIPACKSAAPADAIGQGALQLTTGGGSQVGMAVLRVPLSTAVGLHITFDDYSFKGTSPGSEGIAFFLTDASQPLPTAAGQRGAGLGYAGSATAGAGLANAYVGVGLDEYGGFSSAAGGYVGGPGTVPETIAVRGSASVQYAYLGGATNSAGKAASLPFAFDQPTSPTRPSNVPTVSATLTPAGLLTVGVDRHDGNGAVVYYTGSIVGINGQPAVPANVYFGVSASTGSHTNTHQVSGLVISALASPPPPPAATLISEPFSGSATAPNAWQKYGDACLTAGGSTTPSTSVPPCGAAAPQDPAGSGALELTKAAASNYGIVINKTPLSTANGLQITFTEDAFDGTTPGSEGVAFFLSDASKPLPAHNGLAGGGLGYVGTSATNGLPNGYLAVGLDEYGSFSSSSGGYTGGPGVVPETVAVRGAASIAYAYLGGAVNSVGKASSLPFALDAPTSTTRPASGPTINATLTPAGLLTVAIDHHDGNGFITYFSQSIVGLNGQPAVPANVYFGLSGSTGSHDEVHQISGLTVATIGNVPTSLPASGNPPQVVSSNGSLTFNVSAQADPVTGNPEFKYNGSMVPPTLRLLPGDTLIVNLTNNLPTPPPGSGYTNTTNLHYHGLHVSPGAPGDDSIDMLAAPGQSLHYLVHIPLAHPPGLYWYHSHAHGEAERQTLSGMSGALIIDGIAAYTPSVANMTERVLVARDAPLAGGVLPNADLRQIYAMKWARQHGVAMHAGAELRGTTTAQTRNPYVRVEPRYKRFVRSQTTDQHCVAGSPEAPVKALTLNGATQPTLPIAPGEQQFWRMVNAGADTYLDVQIDNSLMQIVAIDGVPVVSGVGTPASVTASDWVLPPSSRVEFIVTGPPAGTTSYLRTNCFDAGSEGDPMPAAILATLTPPTGSALAARRHSSVVARISPRARRYVFHTAGAVRAHSVRTVAQIRAAGIAATRTLYYTDQNTINGIAYDPAAAPQFYAQSGTVEEWTISNNSNEVHTFHIHQVHFVVEAINGTTLAQQYVMDNVNVPAATQNGPGTVKLLLDFTDPTVIGTFLVHCHILSHEDGGMMAKIRIGLAPPLVPSSSSVTFAGKTAAAQTLTVNGGAAPFSVTGCSGVAFAAVSGSTITVQPFGAGACVLTIADASNPSLTAAVTVNVAAPPAVVTLGSTSVSFSAPTASAQALPIVGGTAPYTVSGCTNVAAGAVTGQSLTITPLGVGICSLVVADALNNEAQLSVGVNAPPNANPLDDLTYHQNNARTGWYQNETVLTTATVGSTHFGPVATLTAPPGMPGLGKVYAQPLYVTNEVAVDGNQHNLIIVAGAAGQVYAFDEKTRAVVWHRDFTNAAAGIRQQLWTDTNCSDVQPDVGIIGTPVIDRSLDAIYVVVATEENGVPYTRLHAIGLGNGNDILAPAVVSGSVALATGGTATINSRFNMNRAALLEANGTIYVALGSHCDAGLAFTHGWLVAYNATTLAQAGSLIDTSNANDGTGLYLGSIWMGGFGPAADAAGNVFVATGNGPFNGTTNFSMSILKVPGNLDLAGASFFTPAQEAVDSLSDRDVSSGGVLLFPDQPGPFAHLLVGGGKCSVPAGCYKYILNRDALGGQQPGNAGALWSADTAGTIFGGPAYFADSSGAQHIVYGSGAPGYPFSTYTLNLAPVGLAIESSANVGRMAGRDAGSTPVVSSNGTMPGTAIVWALKTPANSGGPISLYAFDALNMGTVLYSGVIGTWNQLPSTVGIGEALISPMIANGYVYVPSDGMVMVLGLH